MDCSTSETKAAAATGPLASLDIVSRLLFPAPDAAYNEDDFPGELIWIPKTLDPETSNPEESIPCLFLISPSARFLLFYLHSNAEDLGRCYPFCALLRYQFQAHVLAVEYPGYGLCPGGPAKEETVIENCTIAFRFIREVLNWPLDGILILGRSVGTGPALALAMQEEVYGVILVSPFLSVQEVCKDVIGPLAYLINDRFPNKDRIAKVRSPLLIVHGQKDVVVPVSHGVKLYDECRSRKRLVIPENMHHNTNLHSDANYFVLPMLQFFSLPDYCFDEIRVPLWAYDKRTPSTLKKGFRSCYDARICKGGSCDDDLKARANRASLHEKMRQQLNIDVATPIQTQAVSTRQPSQLSPKETKSPVAEPADDEPSKGNASEVATEADELPEPPFEGAFAKVPVTQTLRADLSKRDCHSME